MKYKLKKKIVEHTSLRYILRAIVMLFLRAQKWYLLNPQIHGNVMRPLFVLNFIFEPLNINQMKQLINIRCMQHFLYFESHTKSLKLLHIIVCISSAFTISTYFINECMYLDEISRKQWYRVHVQTMVQK
jgi:hypothetical protein